MKLLLKILFFLFFLISLHPIQAQSVNQLIEDGKQKLEQAYYTEAIQDFTKALQINGQIEEAFFNRAEANYRIGRYEDALRDYTKAIELNPNMGTSYYYRALVNDQLNNENDALWDYSKAIKLAPNFEFTYVQRAKLYLKQKKYQKALDDCNQSLLLTPDFALALSTRGLVKLELNKVSQAYSDLKDAVRIAPNEADLHSNLADYYLKIGQTEKAIEEYTAAININPRNPEAFHKRALLKLSLGNNADALKDANRAIYNNRRFRPAYVTRAIAYFNTQEYDRSDYDIDMYLSQNTVQSEDFHYLANNVLNYANHASNSNLLVKAEDWAAKAIKLNDNYDNNVLMAEILFKLNRNTFARIAADKANKKARIEKRDPIKALILLSKINKDHSDITPPVIQITSPVTLNRGVIIVEAARKITVIGTVYDNSGVEKVLINGNMARLEAGGNFDGETILNSNSSLITVEAFDKQGNRAVKQFKVEKKTEPVFTSNRNNSSSLLGRQRALLFATDRYDTWTNLFNPIQDAEAIARDLQDYYGFEVDLQRNLSKEEVMLKIKEYARKNYQPNEQLFIFFAGHGQFDDVFKEGYVVARDSKFDEESKSSYISHSNLKTYINSIPCEHIFLVMDVCFGGTFDPMLAMRGANSKFDKDVEEMVRRKMRYKTRRFLTSGGKEYVPDGAPGRHSPFVRKFLEALRSEGGEDGILNISEIINQVQHANPQPHAGEFGTNEPGSDFLLIRR